MSRRLLAESQLHPAVRSKVADWHSSTVDEVAKTVEREAVVIVGMSVNPHVKKARAELTRRGITFTYLEYGGYLGRWRQRTALKMWSGWPTFPMIFVNGVLVGGASDLLRLAESGGLDALLATP